MFFVLCWTEMFFLFAWFHILLSGVVRLRCCVCLQVTNFWFLLRQRLHDLRAALHLLLLRLNTVVLTIFSAMFLFFLSFCINVFAALPANGPAVLAAAGLVAVQCAPAMPLVYGLLSLHAELASSQSRLEAADVEERGVQSSKVVSTCE